MNYAEFNNMFDLSGLKADINSNNTRDFEKVPYGEYEVDITKLELGSSKKSLPMLKCWMKITAGEKEGSMLFMNQLLHTGFGIHNANEFLKTISDENVYFDDFAQYGNLIETIFNEIKDSKLFHIQYLANKGYDKYIVKDIYAK